MCLITRICIGMISSCSLVSSPIACLRQPQAQVSSCSGSSWTTSTRGRLAGNGLRLPRRLIGATTSSASASAGSAVGSSTSSSASLNMASCGESASSGLRSDLGENSLWRSRATCSCNCSTKALSRTGSLGRLSAPNFLALDYTGSGHEPRRQYLVRTIAPQVNSVEQPVQFVNRQFDGLVACIGLGLEALGFQSLEPQAE